VVFNYRILLVVMLLRSSIVFSMESTGVLSLLTKERKITFQSIVKSNERFESSVPKIKALAKYDQEWKQIFDCKFCAEKLINYVEKDNPYKGLVAAFLGTPGAIKWGKEYVKAKPNAKIPLRVALANIAKYDENDCEWPNQDLEVAKAILDMGVEVQATYKDCCEYNFPYDDPGDVNYAICSGDKAGLNAVFYNKVEFVGLLLDYCTNRHDTARFVKSLLVCCYQQGDKTEIEELLLDYCIGHFDKNEFVLLYLNYPSKDVFDYPSKDFA
jgi:hypothetical protein